MSIAKPMSTGGVKTLRTNSPGLSWQSGEHGFAQAVTLLPDLIVLDFGLNSDLVARSGMELCRAFCSLCADLPSRSRVAFRGLWSAALRRSCNVARAQAP
jgi:hypothetical protein